MVTCGPGQRRLTNDYRALMLSDLSLQPTATKIG
jgi:hypothetical protein